MNEVELMNSALKYRVVANNTVDRWQDMELWCRENVGMWDFDWYKLGIDPVAGLFGDNSTTWYFRSDKDAAAFTLKWA